MIHRVWWKVWVLFWFSRTGQMVQVVRSLLLREVWVSNPHTLPTTRFGTTSIFDLWSRPWGVARLGSLWSSSTPRKGSGSTTATTTCHRCNLDVWFWHKAAELNTAHSWHSKG